MDTLFVRSREVSKPRDWYFKLSYRFEIWQAHRQQCCRSACQISERSDNSKYKSRGFETLRDLTKRRLFVYWDGALVLSTGDWRIPLTKSQWRISIPMLQTNVLFQNGNKNSSSSTFSPTGQVAHHFDISIESGWLDGVWCSAIQVLSFHRRQPWLTH